MNEKTEALVVGGGVIGAACAHFLNEAGKKVTIVDAGQFGQGCSHANCGFLTPSHVLPLCVPGAIGKTLNALLRKNGILSQGLPFPPIHTPRLTEYQTALTEAIGFTEKIAEFGELGVNVIGMAMSGGSGPVHLAGTLVVQNCEVLSSLVLNQLSRKGSSFVYGSSTCPLDLRRATATVGSPETGMISAAVARLARYYSLPCFVAGG